MYIHYLRVACSIVWGCMHKLCIVFFCSLLRFSSVFPHRSCLLAHQNAVTVLSVWTLSHWLWPSSMLSQGIPLFFSPRHGISWLLARSRVWPSVSTNTNVRPATKHRSPALAAQPQRRLTWILKCPRTRIGRFLLQIFHSSLRAHSSQGSILLTLKTVCQTHFRKLHSFAFSCVVSSAPWASLRASGSPSPWLFSARLRRSSLELQTSSPPTSWCYGRHLH